MKAHEWGGGGKDALYVQAYEQAEYYAQKNFPFAQC